MRGSFVPDVKEEKIPEPLWFRLYINLRLLVCGGSYVDINGKSWSFYDA